MTSTAKATGKTKASTAKAEQPTGATPAAKALEAELSQQNAQAPAGREFESTEALAHFIQHNPEFGTLPLQEQDALRGQLVSAKRAEAEQDGHWPDGRKRLTLTEGDALADLNGTRRPDNHVD